MSDSKDYIEIDDSIFDELDELFENKIKELKQD